MCPEAFLKSARYSHYVEWAGPNWWKSIYHTVRLHHNNEGKAEEKKTDCLVSYRREMDKPSDPGKSSGFSSDYSHKLWKKSMSQTQRRFFFPLPPKKGMFCFHGAVQAQMGRFLFLFYPNAKMQHVQPLNQFEVLKGAQIFFVKKEAVFFCFP